MKKKLFTIILVLVCTITCTLCFTACDNLKPVEKPNEVEKAEIESVTLDKTELSLEVGGEETITATVTPSDTEETAIWSSSNESVATVTGGKVTAVAEGETTITAKVGDKSATCSVTVSAPYVPSNEVTAEEWANALEEWKKTLEEKAELDPYEDKVVVTNATIKTYDNAHHKYVTSDGVNIYIDEAKYEESGIVIVSKIDEEYYLFRKTDDFWTREHITEKDYLGSKEYYIFDSYIPLFEVINDFKDQFNIFTYTNGKYIYEFKEQNSAVKFEIIFEDGVLVSFYVLSKSDEFTLEYYDIGTSIVEIPNEYIIVESIILDKTELNMKVGDEETLIATVTPSDTEETVIWSSSNESVATVTDGKVTAVAEGETTITAKVGDKYATCSVTVSAPYVPSNEVTAEEWANAFEVSGEIGSYGRIAVTNFNFKLADERDHHYIISDGINYYVDEAYGSGSIIAIAAKIDEEYFFFRKTDDIWTRESVDENFWFGGYEQYVFDVGVMINESKKNLKDKYELFTYSNGKYIYEGTIESVSFSYEVIFEDGVLISVKGKSDNDFIEFYDLGTAVVELPTEFIAITLEETELNMYVGEEETLIANVVPSNIDETVIWSSSNENVATVINGKVTAIGIGYAKITAEICGLSAECLVNVSNPSFDVTAKEWATAFNNFSTNFTMEETQESGGHYRYTVSDGENVRIIETFDNGKGECILNKSNEDYYAFLLESVWLRQKINEEYYTQMLNYYVYPATEMMKDFIDTYSEFTFINGKYVADSVSIGESDYENVEIIFDDGKLISISFEYNNGLGTIVIKNIGTSIVEIPTEFTDVEL